jgi:hypothetical protein
MKGKIKTAGGSDIVRELTAGASHDLRRPLHAFTLLTSALDCAPSIRFAPMGRVSCRRGFAPRSLPETWSNTA